MKNYAMYGVGLATLAGLLFGGCVNHQAIKNEPIVMAPPYYYEESLKQQSEEEKNKKELEQKLALRKEWQKPMSIDTLYSTIEHDVKKNKPLIIASYIGVWPDGTSADNNIYWGQSHAHMFNNSDWKKIYLEKRSEDPVRIAVYGKTFKNGKWGDSLRILNVYLVYNDLRKAALEMTLNLKYDNNRKIVLPDSQEINLSDARIVGYIGHNFYFDKRALGKDYACDSLDNMINIPKEMKGVFCVGCWTSYDFTNLVESNIYGLLFTQYHGIGDGFTMYPGAFNLRAFADGIGNRKSGQEIVNICNEEYARLQGLSNITLFTNQEKGLFIQDR
ncbi:MAG: hypothetical protein ACPLXC_01455 [Candidatus Pacearchaeota archaeon]